MLFRSMLETDTFRIHCFQTLTGTNQLHQVLFNTPFLILYQSSHTLHCNVQTRIGTKFLLVADPQQPSIDMIMKKIYETYSDYTVKNPFQNPEMPIRSEQFDVHLLKMVKSFNGLVVNSSNPYNVGSNAGANASLQSQPHVSSPSLPNIASSGQGLGF